jgi:hypothetical protein
MSMQSLEAFYQSELMPDLTQLEDLRKAATKKMMPVVALVALFNLTQTIGPILIISKGKAVGTTEFRHTTGTKLRRIAWFSSITAWSNERFCPEPIAIKKKWSHPVQG